MSYDNKHSGIAGAALLALLLSTVAFSSDTRAQSALPSGDARAGAKTYETVCKGCHGVSIAPTLRGVVDRPIAGVTSYAGYSGALRAKQEMKWTEENLNTFLTDPAGFAPGTQMVQVIPDAQQRADLIAFLKMLPPPLQ